MPCNMQDKLVLCKFGTRHPLAKSCNVFGMQSSCMSMCEAAGRLCCDVFGMAKPLCEMSVCEAAGRQEAVGEGAGHGGEDQGAQHGSVHHSGHAHTRAGSAAQNCWPDCLQPQPGHKPRVLPQSHIQPKIPSKFFFKCISCVALQSLEHTVLKLPGVELA